MRRGTLTRHLVWQDAGGRRTRVTQRRFVSMKDEHLAGLDTTFTAENWSGTLEVSSGLDGRVVNGSEERRVGKECEVPCRSRWSPYH